MTRDQYAHGFEPDSRLIAWPASRIAEPCAEEGASDPVPYDAGRQSDNPLDVRPGMQMLVGMLLGAVAAVVLVLLGMVP